MKKNSLLCAIILGIMATSLSAQTRKKDYTHQVDSVLNLMTLEEKVGQMIQYSNNKLLCDAFPLPASDEGSLIIRSWMMTHPLTAWENLKYRRLFLRFRP